MYQCRVEKGFDTGEKKDNYFSCKTILYMT